MVVGDLMAKIFIGTYGDRVEPRLIWSAVTFIFAAGLVMVVHAGSVVVVYASAICLGIGFGGGVVLVMTVLGNYFGHTIFASVTGVALAVQTTISAIVPVMGGHYYDVTGSYAMTFYLMAALSLAGAIMLILIRPPRKGRINVTDAATKVPLGSEQVK